MDNFNKDNNLLNGKGEWDESQHPRDNDGMFMSKGGTNNGADICQQKTGKYEGEKTKLEYENAVNNKILEYINKVRNGYNEYFRLSDITNGEIEDIKKLTHIDTTGFLRYIAPDAIRHIDKRHGQKGIADQSMKEDKDLARIEYVLQNYDEITFSGVYNYQYQNSDKTPSKSILYKKRLNGNYFIAEAVPDSKKKNLIITTAYKNKG